ncbi:hypothetical protein GYMLUDRAFT_97694 [Collybiopsis luxurians FD-317 M1]|uniref:Uncharacterized protein n=1 Tax=Collybiopsis luxurians FD-317 M1 TaxID=944289 RepID=A0A0D0CLV7_9AGAR|nr:hypothetical protein GYMLUDRAFT_97694 [Collybiopsis luxurians FD-317 M1]
MNHDRPTAHPSVRPSITITMTFYPELSLHFISYFRTLYIFYSSFFLLHVSLSLTIGFIDVVLSFSLLIVGFFLFLFLSSFSTFLCFFSRFPFPSLPFLLLIAIHPDQSIK